jgi:CheY-like chemotaxis protein
MDSTNGLIHSMIQLVALKNFKAGLYALAILDIIMPQMDGFELYHELTKIDNLLQMEPNVTSSREHMDFESILRLERSKPE